MDAAGRLLEAEFDLRRRTEEVAALRRRLPQGGLIPEDFLCQEGARDLSDTKTNKKFLESMNQ